MPPRFALLLLAALIACSPDAGTQAPGLRSRPAATLPTHADGAFHLAHEGSGLAIEVQLEGALHVPGVEEGGKLVFRAAHESGAELRHRLFAEGTEDHLAFERAPAQESVRYQVTLAPAVAGLRLVADTLEFLDQAGTPRLRVSPPFIDDADGVRHEAHLSVEGCAVDRSPLGPWGRAVVAPGARTCAVRVDWSLAGVKYPAVLDPAWTLTGSMTVARTQFALVTLGNGRALAIGGLGANGVNLRSAELFDPATSTWSATSSMSGGGAGVAAIALDDGRALAVGGTATVSIAGLTFRRRHEHSELYDPTRGLWVPTGLLQSARSGAAIILVEMGDGIGTQPLLAGGVTGIDNSIKGVTAAERFDLATSTWIAAGNTRTAWTGQQFVRTPCGQILLVGGADASGRASPLVDDFVDRWMVWTAAPSLPRARTAVAAARASDAVGVLVAGGLDADGHPLDEVLSFDCRVLSWSQLPALAEPTSGHTLTSMGAGNVMLAGGSGAPAGSSSFTTTELNSYQTLRSDGGLLARAVTGHSAALTPGGLLLAGGLDKAGVVTAASQLHAPVPRQPVLTIDGAAVDPNSSSNREGPFTMVLGVQGARGTTAHFFDGTTEIGSCVLGSAGCAITVSVDLGHHLYSVRLTLQGMTSDSSARALVDDRPFPPILSVTQPSPGLLRVTVHALPGALVRIDYSNFEPSIERFADGSGFLRSDLLVDPGLYRISARQAAYEEWGYSTDEIAVTVADPAPALVVAPAGNAALTGYLLASATSPSTTVALFDGTRLVGQLLPSGYDSVFEGSFYVGFGAHSLTAVGTTNGVTSPPSPAVAISLPLGPPLISSPTPGAVLPFPEMGFPLLISGLAAPGADVLYTLSGEGMAEVPASGKPGDATPGTWTSELRDPAPGVHSLSAVQLLPGQLTSAASPGVTFAVLPPAPTLTAAADAPVGAQYTIQGLALPGASVTLVDEEQPSEVAGADLNPITTTLNLTADAQGNFSTAVTLSFRQHAFTATQAITDPALAAPLVSPASAKVEVLPVPPAPVLLSPAEGGQSAGLTLLLEGTGEPGLMVSATLDGAAAPFEAEVDAEGRFSLQIPAAFGPHTVAVVQSDGVSSPPGATVHLRFAPPPPAITAPAANSVNVGSALTVIAQVAPGAGLALSDNGGAMLVVPGQANGKVEAQIALPFGVHTLDFVATGFQVASAKATVKLTVLPPAPIVSAVPISDTTRVAISGSTVPSTLVFATVDGSRFALGVDQNGVVSAVLDLGYGLHTLSFTAAFGGVESPPFAAPPVNFPPPPPRLDSPISGQHSTGLSLPVSGLGVPGCAIDVFEGTSLLASGKVAADGTISFALPQTLEEGQQPLFVGQTCGGSSAPLLGPVVVLVDRTPPKLYDVPGPLAVELTSGNSATVSWVAPTAQDDFDGAREVTCSPASGTAFSRGVTTVTCTASDTVGNVASASFVVTVADAAPPAPSLAASDQLRRE